MGHMRRRTSPVPHVLKHVVHAMVVYRPNVFHAIKRKYSYIRRAHAYKNVLEAGGQIKASGLNSRIRNSWLWHKIQFSYGIISNDAEKIQDKISRKSIAVHTTFLYFEA